MSDDMPKVSVIIPVYGTEGYVGETIECLLGQTLQDIEVICVEDCSPDGSGAVIDAYASRDPRVVAVHLPENHGQGYARNVGLDIARGEYVYFLDSDDVCEPQTLSVCTRLADEDQLDGVFFDMSAFSSDHELMREYGTSHPTEGVYPEGVATGAELFDALVMQKEWACFPQRQLWRRSFLMTEGIRFPDASSHEDELFSHVAFLSARRMRYVREQLFAHRWRAGSVMTSPPTPKRFYSYFRAYMGMVEFDRAHGITLRSAEINAARIYDYLCGFLSLLGEDALRPWFHEHDERLLFEFFVESRKVDLANYLVDMVEGIISTVREAKRVFVYGAGSIGKRVMTALEIAEVPFEGVLVSSLQDNPDTVMGRRVITLSEAGEPREGDLVIVSVSMRFKEEIEGLLDAAGWQHVYYKDEES